MLYCFGRAGGFFCVKVFSPINNETGVIDGSGRPGGVLAVVRDKKATRHH